MRPREPFHTCCAATGNEEKVTGCRFCTFKHYRGMTTARSNSNLLLFQQLNVAFTVRGQFLVSHTAGKETAR